MPERISTPPRSLYPSSLPMQERKKVWPRPLILLLSSLLIIAMLHFIAVTHTAYPTPKLANCSDLIRNTDYTKFLHMENPQQELDAIQFVDQLVNATPAALVPVNNNDPQHSLDIYIYGCSMQKQVPQLRLLFKQQNLAQGSVQISRANTLLISALDPTLSPVTRMQIEPWQQFIYREYAWQQGTFLPQIFPGFYPVLTRSEAEILQSQYNAGQEFPWNDPLISARQLALDLLHWSAHDLQSHLQSLTMTEAKVLLTRKHPNEQVSVALKRLIQLDKNGLWFVTAAQSPGLSLDLAQFHTPLSSPLLLRGTLSERLGKPDVALFNHLLLPLPLLNHPVLNTLPTRTFTTTLLYTNNISDQPGILLLENAPPRKSKASGQIFMTGITLA